MPLYGRDWDQAWGVPAGGVHTLTTAFNTASTHTTAQAEGLTITVDDLINRRVKITFQANVYVPGGVNSVRYRLRRDGSTLRDWDIPTEALSTSIGHGLTLTYEETIAATHADSVYDIYMLAITNNTQVSSYGAAAYPRQLMLEDIGPA